MKKILLLSVVLLFCVSICSAKVFMDFEVDTDKTIGCILIGGGVYYGLIMTTPTGYAIGTVGIISGIGLLFDLF